VEDYSFSGSNERSSNVIREVKNSRACNRVLIRNRPIGLRRHQREHVSLQPRRDRDLASHAIDRSVNCPITQGAIALKESGEKGLLCEVTTSGCFEVESGNGVFQVEGNFKRGECISIAENVGKVRGAGDDESFGDAVDLTEIEGCLQ